MTPTLRKKVTRRSARAGITTLSYRFFPPPGFSLAVFYAKSFGPPLVTPYFKFNPPWENYGPRGGEGKYVSAGVQFFSSQHTIYQKVKVCPPLPLCLTASYMPCLKA